MAKWEFSGLDKYVEQLHQLERRFGVKGREDYFDE